MMDWSRWRNPVRNFVNLTALYGKGWQVRLPFKLGAIRPGWAYFEDGSVFFPRFPYANEELQEVMKVAAAFVRNPSDGHRALQAKDANQTRMVLLENLGDDSVISPDNLHIYGRYVRNGESLLVPSTRYSTITLKLDPARSTHLSTKFGTEQVLTTAIADRHHFLPVEQWVTSSRAFRGTLVDGVLQPGVRLGNGLEFTLMATTAATLEPTPKENQASELKASRSAVEAEWTNEFRYLRLKDFASAVSFDPPLESSLGLHLRRGFGPLEAIEGGMSLSEQDLDLRQREKELKRLSSSLLWEADAWRRRNVPGLKSAADELETQKRRLHSQLESQLLRQEAWGHCEDDALKRANLEERELILKAEVGQLKWMQMNWLWFNRFMKLERALGRVTEERQGLRERQTILEQRLRKHGLADELKRAVEGKQMPVAAPERRNLKATPLFKEEVTKSPRSRTNQKQAKITAPPKAEAVSIFEFLEEDATDTPDAVEMYRRAAGTSE